jgi:hypothetical protein
MKHSKLYLAGTTGLLAIAGVGAVKAQHALFKMTKCFFYTLNSNKCIYTGQALGFTLNSKMAMAVTLTTAPNAGTMTICYSLKNTLGACTSRKLYTNGID